MRCSSRDSFPPKLQNIHIKIRIPATRRQISMSTLRTRTNAPSSVPAVARLTGPGLCIVFGSVKRSTRFLMGVNPPFCAVAPSCRCNGVDELLASRTGVELGVDFSGSLFGLNDLPGKAASSRTISCYCYYNLFCWGDYNAR